MEKLRECPFCGNQPYHTKNGETISCMTGINEGEHCPIAGMDFTLAEWNTSHEPKHETVEQWEKRTGVKYKWVQGYEYLYMISSIGEVLSFYKGEVKILQENNKGYDTALLYKDGIGKRYYVHRLVYSAFVGDLLDSEFIDHKDLNKKNNAFTNLRKTTRSLNAGNTNKLKNTTSYFKGVHYDSERNKWFSQIKKDKKSIFLGRFDNHEDAGRAYDKKAIEIFGEHARTNEMLGLYGKPDSEGER